MSSLINKAIIEIASGSASAWTSANPVLNNGEWGREDDTGRTKNGDGSTAWNDLIYSDAPPIGAQYIQYAISASNDAAVSLPTAEAPTALFGGTWEKLWETESVFFRTEGTLADTDRTSGLQEDQFQGHKWQLDLDATSGSAGTHAYLAGSFAIDGAVDGIATDSIKTPLDNGTDGTPRTGAFTHPKNRLMRIWRRTA